MSRWRAETAYIGRYVGTGAFNTLVGFGIIFGLMWAGVSPVAANTAGYACGFVMGFALSRKLVFGSSGGLLGETGRYVLAFLVAFLLNIAALRLAIDRLALPPAIAQVVAAVTFTGAMYVLSRLFVFSPGKAPAGRDATAGSPKARAVSLAAAAAVATIVAVPVAFAFHRELDALPQGVRLLASGVAAAIVLLGALQARLAVQSLGAARGWILGATLLFGLALYADSDVPVQSADVAQVRTSDGQRQEGVKPSVVTAWGRDVQGYGLHPAYGTAGVANALVATFPSHPGEVTLLLAKPKEVLFDAEGKATPSDGISVEVQAFDAAGKRGYANTLLIPQSRFLAGGWIEERIRIDGGVGSVAVLVGPGPPGSTPGWDSTLVGFETTPWQARIEAVGRVMLLCMGLLVVALVIALNLAAFSTARAEGRSSGRARALLQGAALVASLLLLAYWSQSNTSYIYFWDYRNYWEKTETLHGLLSAGAWREAVDAFTAIYTSSYSMLPALGPALLSLLTGSPTRVNYALSITALYAAPAYLMVTLLARRVLDGAAAAPGAAWGRGWMLASFPVAVGLPAFFGTTLYLMPDIGGVILVVAALLSASTMVDAIRDPGARLAPANMSTSLFRASLSLGLLLGLMFVFRRWYAFAAAGVAFATACLVLVDLATARSSRPALLSRALRSAAVVGLAALPLLCWFVFAWSRDLGRHDYATLYSSYGLPLSVDALKFAQSFGIAVLALCVAGGAALHRFGKDRRLLFLVTASTLVAAALFLTVQSPGPHHYFLLMPLLGSFLAGLSLVLARRWGLPALLAITLLLGLGSAFASRPLSETYGFSLFAGHADVMPRQQENAAGLAELAQWLDSPGVAGRKFCLVASSGAINQGMFSELWQILPTVDRKAYAQRMLRLGQVDSMDGPPVTAVMECEIFLVGVPFQVHLPPDQQSTMGIIQQDMVAGTGIGQAVGREPRIFPMGPGVEVRAYLADRPVTRAEYDDLVRRFLANKAASETQSKDTGK
jgi:putative flippase GtrA